MNARRIIWTLVVSAALALLTKSGAVDLSLATNEIENLSLLFPILILVIVISTFIWIQGSLVALSDLKFLPSAEGIQILARDGTVRRKLSAPISLSIRSDGSGSLRFRGSNPLENKLWFGARESYETARLLGLLKQTYPGIVIEHYEK